MAWTSDNHEPGTWTDEAVTKISGSISRALRALADGDNDAFDAEAAEARKLMDDPRNKHQ